MADLFVWIFILFGIMKNDLSPAVFCSVAVRVVQVQGGRTLSAASVPLGRMSENVGTHVGKRRGKLMRGLEIQTR